MKRRADLLRHVMPNVDLLVVQQHTIDGFDSRLCSLGAVIVNEAVTLGTSALVRRNLARKNVTKGGKSIVESLGYKFRTNKQHRRSVCGSITLLSICSSRFLMKILPWPVLRRAGSR